MVALKIFIRTSSLDDAFGLFCETRIRNILITLCKKFFIICNVQFLKSLLVVVDYKKKNLLEIQIHILADLWTLDNTTMVD